MFPLIKDSPSAPIRILAVFFRVQLSHPYMTTGKTIALTIWTFVGKEMAETYAVTKEDLTAWPWFLGSLALKESGPHVLRTLQQPQKGLHMAED